VNTAALANRVVSGVFWLAVTKFLGQAINWVITLVVVRLLVPHDYGLMGLALLFTRFMMLFNELGLGAAIVQKREMTERQLSDVAWVIFLANLALCGLLLLLAPVAAHYFNEPALTSVVRAMGVLFVINGIGAASGFILQRDMAFRTKAAAEVAGNVVSGVVTLVLAMTGTGVWSLVLGQLAGQAATNGLYLYHAPVRLARGFTVQNVRSFLHFGYQVAFSKAFWWFSTSADSLIVGRVLGAVQLGYYGLAVQFAAIPLDRIVSLIGQVALPSFAAVQHDLVTLRRHYLKMVGAIGLITFPIFFGMAFLADIGVRVVLTEKWTPIIEPLQLLCITSCLRAIETMNTPALLARNRPGPPLFNSILQAIVLSIAFLVGSRWGIVGVAVAWLVTWPGLFLIATGWTLSILGIRVAAYADAIRHPALATIAMVVSVLAVRRLPLLSDPSITGLILTSAVGCLSYVSYHALFNRATLREVGAILKSRRASRPAVQPAEDSESKSALGPVAVQPTVVGQVD
jgi:O-antigen/teichoic acid export membrane protein